MKQVKSKMKYEFCIDWILEILSDYHGAIPLIELRRIGMLERERYCRQDIYIASKMLGNRIVYAGVRKFKILYTKELYEKLNQPKDMESVFAFLDMVGYETSKEYIEGEGLSNKLGE